MSRIRIGSQLKRRLMNEIAIDVGDMKKKLKTTEQELADVNERFGAALFYIHCFEKTKEDHDFETCDSCCIPFRMDDDYKFICSANEYDQCSVWCQRDFCKQNVFKCDGCGYGTCKNHQHEFEDGEHILCRTCNKEFEEKE